MFQRSAESGITVLEARPAGIPGVSSDSLATSTSVVQVVELELETTMIGLC